MHTSTHRNAKREWAQCGGPRENPTASEKNVAENAALTSLCLRVCRVASRLSPHLPCTCALLLRYAHGHGTRCPRAVVQGAQIQPGEPAMGQTQNMQHTHHES